jgi:hypothetical protein
MYSSRTFSSAGDRLYVCIKGGSVPGFKSIAWSVSLCGANLLASSWLKNFGNFSYKYSGTWPPWQSRKDIFLGIILSRCDLPGFPFGAQCRVLAPELPHSSLRRVAAPEFPHSGSRRIVVPETSSEGT